MQRIWDKLRQLATYDSNSTVFGSSKHKYRVHPCLTETEITEFEQQHRVTLPKDYRRFLLEIANGGAGPDYGLHRLQDSVREANQNLLSQPWPHHAEWNLSYNDFASAKDHEEVYFREDQVQGALSLSDIGCGHRSLLVITGEESGTVWEDYRNSDEGIVPMQHGADPVERVSFIGWYEAWLDKSLAT